MAVNLSKGDNIELNATMENLGIKTGLTRVAVGLGWDPSPYVGNSFDLDAWALAISDKESKKSNDLVYFGNLHGAVGSISHKGDNLTGKGDGDDETIVIDFTNLGNESANRYNYIVVGVTLYRAKSRNQSFRDVENAFIRLYNYPKANTAQNQTEICKYTDKFKEVDINCDTIIFGIFAKTVKNNENIWYFNAVGKGYTLEKIPRALNIYNEFLTLINQKEEKKIMAVSLSKGGKVSLAKVAADAGIQGGLSKIVVGLGWDVNKYDGGAQFDLDAAAFMLGENGKVRSDSDFIFYNNKTGPGVEHTGDNRTGEGDGDDEQIKVDLTAIPADVAKISFSVTIDQASERNQNFGMVENSYIHVIDEATGTELIRYDLGEDFSVETAIVVADIYRNNGEWKFNAVGSGFAGGLAALCGNFGVNVG